MRKTLPVATLVEIANGVLLAPEPTRAERLAITVVLEAALITAGAYRGFRYLSAEDLAPGVLPGVVTTEDAAGWSSHVYPDDSRRAYF